MKPVIGFDVDGPLVFDNYRIKGFFNYLRNIGVECRYDVFLMTGDWFLAVPKLGRPEISESWCRYRNARKIQDMPTPGAVTAVRSLVHAERIIATARTDTESPATLEFLRQHYGSFRASHFALDCKIAVAKETRFFIDDSLSIANAVAAANNDTQVILFPTPGYQRKRAHQRVIILEAERDVHSEMTEEQLHHMCTKAWGEIVTIVQPAAMPA